MARFARRGDRRPGQAACPVPARPADGAGQRARRRRAVDDLDAVHQHDPARAGAVVPRRRAHRAPDPRVRALERGGDGGPGEPPLRRARRPPLDLRVRRRALRGRVQPLLPRQGQRRLRRPGVLPGPRRAGHLRPRVPRGPADRGAPRRVPARGVGDRTASRATRTRGACRTSGSSRPSRWGSAR